METGNFATSAAIEAPAAAGSSVNRLAKQFPWPAQRPSLRRVDWGLDAGGKKLVKDLIRKLPRDSVVLEIGSFLGGSALQWLQCSGQFTLICVDPWVYRNSIRRFAIRQGQPEWVVRQIDQPDGGYLTFLNNLWEYRHRVIPMRGCSQEMLPLIAAAGVRPSLIYLDADKTGREIEPCHALFPEAIITGDDWWFGVDRWRRPDEGYPIRRPVRAFCRRHGRYLRTSKMTWVIDTQPPPLAWHLTRPLYYWKATRRRLRGLLRASIGRGH
jgi:hypothetical protein